MKRKFLTVLGMAAALSMVTTTAFAAGPGGRRNFVDTNGDGICDNAGSMCSYVDADGDGICDNYMTGLGRGNGRGNGIHGRCGGNYIDADGDGVCDNYVSGQGQCGGQGGIGFQGGRSR